LSTSAPVASQDAANKEYVDDKVAAIDIPTVPTATAATATEGGAPGIVALAAGSDTSSWDKAAPAASLAGKVSGGGTGAPLPKTGAGVGQMQLLRSTSGAVTLPSGSTWFWLALVGVNQFHPYSSEYMDFGISAGGTNVSRANCGVLCWRIT
jgi:hypothetical protein